MLSVLLLLLSKSAFSTSCNFNTLVEKEDFRESNTSRENSYHLLITRLQALEKQQPTLNLTKINKIDKFIAAAKIADLKIEHCYIISILQLEKLRSQI